jgi:hypothetical protein
MWGLVVDKVTSEQIPLTVHQAPSVFITTSMLHNRSIICQLRYQCLATGKVVKQGTYEKETIQDHASN